MNNDEVNLTENQNQTPPSGNPAPEPKVQTSASSSSVSQISPRPLQSSGQSRSEQSQNAEQANTGQSGVSEEEKKQNHLVMIEAALYVAGRPLDLNEICAVINSRSKKRAQQLVRELNEEYASRSTALVILELRDERYVLQLKAEYTPLVKKFVNRPLLSAGPLKTLSYIAYRQPISQKRVIEVRGQHAYGHVKMLREMDLISPERNGRSVVLRTTDYFADYFGLAQDTSTMKRDLKRIFGDFPIKIDQQANTQLQAKDEQQQ
jgi:segregation and condensation protein B